MCGERDVLKPKAGGTYCVSLLDSVLWKTARQLAHLGFYALGIISLPFVAATVRKKLKFQWIEFKFMEYILMVV